MIYMFWEMTNASLIKYKIESFERILGKIYVKTSQNSITIPRENVRKLEVCDVFRSNRNYRKMEKMPEKDQGGFCIWMCTIQIENP